MSSADLVTMRPRSLYVHVPFCARRCSYCDFAVQATREPPVHAWTEAIGAELELVARRHGWSAPLDLETIYIGGGTPSLLGTGAMAALADRLRAHAVWNPDQVEWTCEANPESFTRALAEDWRAAGINRISLGVQTFHADSLRWMGRLHGPDGPAHAMAAARQAGFDNVNVDLIFALPDRLGRDWAADIERALALEPEHISLYGLTAEPGAALGRWVREGRERMADEDCYADEYLLAHEHVTAAGFEHYEVSNFALPGRRSRHNSVYWTGLPYAALGPGAHAYAPPRRSWNLRSWDAYRNAIAGDQLPIDQEEIVSAADASLERVWLSFRTSSGMSLRGSAPGQRALVHEWVKHGLAQVAADRVTLTAQGWLLLDRLAVEFDAATSPVAGTATGASSGT